MDPPLLQGIVASREFQNVGDLMTDVATGGSARLLAVWALAMRTNRRPWKDLTHLLFTSGRSPVGTLFSRVNYHAWGDF